MTEVDENFSEISKTSFDFFAPSKEARQLKGLFIRGGKVSILIAVWIFGSLIPHNDESLTWHWYLVASDFRTFDIEREYWESLESYSIFILRDLFGYAQLLIVNQVLERSDGWEQIFRCSKLPSLSWKNKMEEQKKSWNLEHDWKWWLTFISFRL